jgi:hypothetical protein
VLDSSLALYFIAPIERRWTPGASLLQDLYLTVRSGPLVCFASYPSGQRPEHFDDYHGIIEIGPPCSKIFSNYGIRGKRELQRVVCE